MQFAFTESELREIHIHLGNARVLLGANTGALQIKVEGYINSIVDKEITLREGLGGADEI